jgi:phage shock protein PspC (stress-responsive transcriptional regulator)
MNSTPRQLFRSKTNKMIGGVCAGLGYYANIDPTIVRLLTALLFFVTGPVIIVAYLVMALIIPEEPTQPVS